MGERKEVVVNIPLSKTDDVDAMLARFRESGVMSLEFKSGRGGRSIRGKISLFDFLRFLKSQSNDTSPNK